MAFAIRGIFSPVRQELVDLLQQHQEGPFDMLYEL